MSCLKTSQLFVTLLAIFNGCFCQNCNLDEVKRCLDFPADTLKSLEDNPFELNLLNEIKRVYSVDHSLESCEKMLESLPHSCTANDKAPYYMLIRTAKVLLNSATDPVTTCLNLRDTQYEYATCFYVLQRNLLYLNRLESKDPICCAYASADFCVHATQQEYCRSPDSATLIQGLLSARIEPWTEQLDCPKYA